MNYNIEAIVVGVSAGGFKALHTILPLFPRDFLIPIIIVQHRREDHDNFFVESLNRCCKLIVKEPEDKEKIRSGIVYIAPAEYHLFVERNFTFSLSADEPVHFARPSIDVLFESAACTYKDKLAGIILTGANNDGSNGIKVIKEYGGLTIVQTPEDAEVDSMPRSAILTKSVDFILFLKDIVPFIIGILEEKDV